MFLSLDGIDGVGKSTQLKLLVEKLQHLGREVITCREPGSTQLGESIRKILLNDWETPIDVVSEMLLYMASRAQLVQEVIRPALERGQTVIADRYLLASVVYQGCGDRLDTDSIWDVGRVATGGLLPDLTIVLDLPLDEAASRIGEPDRIESRGDAYREALRKEFLAEAENRPEQIQVVDARGTKDEVADRIWSVVEKIVESDVR
ncbi:MAG: dTMP kinase [Pirellulales bacterium]|nr:dTMP kinase [Pirellulales bacterium]